VEEWKSQIKYLKLRQSSRSTYNLRWRRSIWLQIGFTQQHLQRLTISDNTSHTDGQMDRHDLRRNYASTSRIKVIKINPMVLG
jgi:hypothetical protein